MKIQLAGFLDNSTVNGTGIRSVVFVSGCDIGCKGCQNKEMQDPNYGDEVEVEEVIERIKANMPIINGVTISGGDPTCQAKAVYYLIRYCSEVLHLNVWLYTGHTYEELYYSNNKELLGLISFADVVVDGPFIEELRDSDLKYRGSSNQRIISTMDTMIATQDNNDKLVIKTIPEEDL